MTAMHASAERTGWTLGGRSKPRRSAIKDTGACRPRTADRATLSRGPIAASRHARCGGASGGGVCDTTASSCQRFHGLPDVCDDDQFDLRLLAAEEQANVAEAASDRLPPLDVREPVRRGMRVARETTQLPDGRAGLLSMPPPAARFRAANRDEVRTPGGWPAPMGSVSLAPLMEGLRTPWLERGSPSLSLHSSQVDREGKQAGSAAVSVPLLVSQDRCSLRAGADRRFRGSIGCTR